MITDVVEISGATFFNDSVEGRAFDNSKLYCAIDLDDTNGRAFGRGSYAYPGMTSEIYQRLLPLYEEAKARGLPLMAEVDKREVLKGGKSTTIICAVRPLPLPKVGGGGAVGGPSNGLPVAPAVSK